MRTETTTAPRGSGLGARGRAALAAGAVLSVLSLSLLIGEPVAAQDEPTPQADLADVSDEVMCPICGVPLDQALEAPQAQEEREFIRDLITKGLTKDEIKDRLVANYGQEVLAVPDTEGFDLAAWIVPGLGVLLAAVGIGFGLRRWRRETPAVEGTAHARPPDGTEAERLDEDLARYEL